MQFKHGEYGESSRWTPGHALFGLTQNMDLTPTHKRLIGRDVFFLAYNPHWSLEVTEGRTGCVQQSGTITCIVVSGSNKIVSLNANDHRGG